MFVAYNFGINGKKIKWRIQKWYIFAGVDFYIKLGLHVQPQLGIVQPQNQFVQPKLQN